MDMRYSPTIRSELRRVYLFGELSDAQMDRIVEDARLLNLEKGESVYTYGEVARNFFLVRSGNIKLHRISASGQEKVIDLVGAGRTFGESLIFAGSGTTYPTHAQAIERSVVLVFTNELFRGLLEESVKTCFRLMGAMSQRLHQQINEIDGLTLHDATYRLVTYLLEQLPEGVVQSRKVFLHTSKSVIASRLSIQPETFSRILARLTKRGLLEADGNYIVLHDIPALRALVDSQHAPCPLSR